MEVLIAIVLLGVGLLALQSLGILAIRSVFQADRTTRSAALASEWLEDAVGFLRINRRPPDFSCTLANGDRLVRALDLTNPSLPRVTMSVTPEPRGGTERPSVFASSVYLATPVLSPPSDARTPCP
jgi:hypothetical protein